MSAYEEYNGPVSWADCSAEEIKDATDDGILCTECGTEFVKPHQHRVACSYCFTRMTEAEVRAEGVRLATHEEVSRQAHINAARKRKAKRNNA